MKSALIFYGGWEGHQPKEVSALIEQILKGHGFLTERTEGTDCLLDLDKLMSFDLIVPCVTMSSLPRECSKNVLRAVSLGVGIAGCHGGMGDSFREDTDWQFLCGGQWVAHPGGDGIDYTVNICHGSSPIVDGIEDFKVCSEQYYLHVDPAVDVLATTRFALPDCYPEGVRTVDVPVVWTKYWGTGRVFYCSLGHHADVFDKVPAAKLLMERGMLWAAGGKDFIEENGIDAAQYIK